MAKMTRQYFANHVEGLWEVAQANFRRDLHLSPCLVGYDALGRQLTCMQVSADHPADDPDLAGVRRHNVVIVRGAWVDNLDQLRAIVAQHKLVAGVLIGEAWLATGDVALDVVAEDMPAGAHPLSDEVAVLYASWPREHFATAHQARIVRDDRGNNPALEPFELNVPASGHFSWLSSILPAPY